MSWGHPPYALADIIDRISLWIGIHSTPFDSDPDNLTPRLLISIEISRSLFLVSLLVNVNRRFRQNFRLTLSTQLNEDFSENLFTEYQFCCF